MFHTPVHHAHQPLTLAESRDLYLRCLDHKFSKARDAFNTATFVMLAARQAEDHAYAMACLTSDEHTKANYRDAISASCAARQTWRAAKTAWHALVIERNTA